MLNETFYIDGVDARNFGIYLQKPIEFSEAVPVVERQSIPGRNGDLIFETGSYENRTGTASCFCLQKDVEKAISAAGRFLMAKHGYRRLETSDDPDHFWLARVENSPQIMQRMRTLAPFEITFDCKPQRFLKSGEEKIVLFPEQSSGDPAFGVDTKINNPFGFPARPLITIELLDESIGGLADIVFANSFGETKRIMCNLTSQTLCIDCETHNAYNEIGNQNNNVTTYEFPTLDAGENTTNFFVLGLKKIEIVPRWWEL